MPRPMVSDRQHFIQTLAQARNLAIDCGRAEQRDSPLRAHCERIIHRIDDVAEKLVDDAGYFKVIEA